MPITDSCNIPLQPKNLQEFISAEFPTKLIFKLHYSYKEKNYSCRITEFQVLYKFQIRNDIMLYSVFMLQ